MKIIKREFGSEFEHMNIYPIADLHIGSKHFKRKRLEMDLEVIKSDPNGLLILNGDLVNNSIKTSIGDIYEETLNPEEQIDLLVELFEPLKDKIIGVVSGNHEDRTYKITGISVLKNFCYRLGIIDVYSNISNMTFLSFGKSKGRDTVKQTFTIYNVHGRGGGKLIGSKANRVHNLSSIAPTADLYIHSHTHAPITFKDSYVLTDTRNKGVSIQDRLYVNTNAYEGFGGYGEVIGLAPSNHDMIKVRLSYDKKRKYLNATL
jgi:hypothetical protein